MPSTLPRLLIFAMMVLSGCTTITVDEYRAQQDIRIGDGEQVVILGRRHSSEYETEPELVNCIGSSLTEAELSVIPEREFVDSLYPWFEPRTAPMRVEELGRLLNNPPVAEKVADLNIRYLVWVDGSTQTTDSKGSIGCSIGVGGAGCFGFGTWEKESDYEANIWDFQHQRSLGQISTDASGTSYMPAVIVPIPIIARVQKNACKAMGAQLRSFFDNDL